MITVMTTTILLCDFTQSGDVTGNQYNTYLKASATLNMLCSLLCVCVCVCVCARARVCKHVFYPELLEQLNTWTVNTAGTFVVVFLGGGRGRKKYIYSLSKQIHALFKTKNVSP